MNKNYWRNFKASLNHKGKIYTLQGRLNLRRGIFPGEVAVFPRTRGMVVMQNTKWRPLLTVVQSFRSKGVSRSGVNLNYVQR